MDNKQNNYFTELGIALQGAGYTVQPEDAGILPVGYGTQKPSMHF